MPIRDEIVRQKTTLDKKQDVLPIFRAVLCDATGLTTGSGSVWADEDERLVWYRKIGTTQAAQVRCVRLEPQLGLGVLIGYADGSNEQEVLSDDPFLRASGLGGRAYLSVSGRDLEPGGRLQMWLYSKAFIPLAVYPGTGLSVSVVRGDYEAADGTRKTFNGQLNKSIAAHQPAGPTQHCLVGVYLDTANALQTVAGATVATSATAPEPSWPADAVRLAVVDLDDTQTTINFADDITDRRLYFPYPGSGAILKTFLDAKGDLITATAADTPAILTVGANNTRLIPDSSQAKGLRWGRLDNYTAAAAPTANDDSGDGYEVGSIWIDTTADTAYVCVDATATAAIWKELGRWPYPKVHTVSSSGADFTSVATAIADAGVAAGDIIEVGENVTETNLAVNKVLTIRGVGQGVTITITTGSTLAAGIIAGAYITAAATLENITIVSSNNTTTNHAVFCDANCTLRNVIASATASTNRRGITVNTARTVELIECEGTATGGGGDNTALLVSATGNIRGGKFSGDDYDIYVSSSSTANLNHPPLFANGRVYVDSTGSMLGDYVYNGDLLNRVRVHQAAWFDYALVDRLNTSGIASPFKDFDSSYPDGWTETSAAELTNTNQRYSFWYLQGSSTDTDWKYRIKSAVNLESTTASSFNSFMIGPVIMRQTAYTADWSFRFGLYRDNAGTIDEQTYIRVLVYWNSGASSWQIQGEEKDGTTAHTGTAYTLDQVPVVQPFYLRVLVNNAAAKTVRAYTGTSPIGEGHFQLLSQVPTSAPTWGDMWVQIQRDRGAGINDYIFIGGVDYLFQVA